MVDPGGNWLRVSKLGDDEETRETTTGLARVIENAARLGDAKGDDQEAIRLLENGLERFSDAPASNGPGPFYTWPSSTPGLEMSRLRSKR